MRIDNPIGINAALTGSFSGSFYGNGSGLTGVAASNVEFANVLNKPTLLSGSAQIASQISGSFTAVSASIATRFDNLGTGFATDSELANVSSSLAGDITNIYNTHATDIELANVSSSLAGSITTNYNTFGQVSSSLANRITTITDNYATDAELAAVSASLAGNVATIFSTYATDTELANVSSSFATSVTSINNTINGLDSTYATDAQLAAVSSSLVQVDSNINATITAVSSSLVQTIQGVDSRLTTVSGSLATRIDNINTNIGNLDSTYATDAELILVSSSFASTTSTNVQIARLNSGSFAGRIDSINSTINNLGSTYATDSELASVSSSLSTRIAADESNLTTAIGVNNTQNNRLAALEAATGSYQAGLTFNDTFGQGGIDFTNTSGTITANAVGLGPTSDVVFNNGTFNGSVLIDGNLIVSGSNTSLQVQNLQVADAFIYLNSGSNSTNPDMGFAGNYNDGTYHHAGFFRDASDAGTFKVFENYGPEPDASIYIDTTHATFRLAPFAAAKITATSITGSLSGNASTASKLATARTITLGGDLTGNVSFDGSAGVTLTATIAADSVALGTDTTGNYVASLVAGTGISLANNTGEGATPTITNSAPDQTVVLTAGSNVSISGTYPNFTIASTDTNTTYTASTGLSLTGTAFSIDSSVVTLSGAQTLTNKTINGSQLVDASVANAKLTNSSVTVTAGTGMSGGGAVSLGSSITLTNAGVTSNVAGTGISVSGGTGAVTITNSDRGSSQNIFKNIAVSGQSTVVADGNDDTLTFAGAGATTITTNASTDTITISSTDTTYSVGDGGLTQVNFTTTRRDKLDGIAANANNYSLPTATSTALGGIELFSDTAQSVAANSVSSTASRTYGLQLNAASQGVVNVPWTDTTYSVGDGGLTAVNFTTTRRDKLDGIAAGATNVTNNNQISNGAGYITASSSDTLTNKSGNISQWTNNSGYITSSATSLNLSGNLTVSSGNTTGGGIILADDGDIVDMNDAYCSMRFTAGVRVFSANRGGSAVITLSNGGSITASGDITAFSDERVKENINTIENALDKVKALRGVTYNRTDKEDKSEKIGVIAQEIQEVLPQVVHEDVDGMLGVSYGNITAVLIEAMKEQQAQIELLKAEIAELKNK